MSNLNQAKKNSLEEKEFQQLIERLSQRKKELQKRITLETVRDALTEAGLIEFLNESDIEEVRNQANKAIGKRQRRNTFLLTVMPILLLSPLLIFAGYKLYPLSTQAIVNEEKVDLTGKLEEEIAKLKNDNEALQDDLEDIKRENNKLTNILENITIQTPQPKEIEETAPDPSSSPISTPTQTPTPTPNQPSSSPASLQSYEIEGLSINLEKCQTSNQSQTEHTIFCFISITSLQEDSNVRIYAYNNSNQRSRFVENGQEYNARQVEFGSESNRYSSTANVPKDVPLKTKITFREIPLEVQKLQIFELGLSLSNSQYRNFKIVVDFRNVPLSDS